MFIFLAKIDNEAFEVNPRHWHESECNWCWYSTLHCWEFKTNSQLNHCNMRQCSFLRLWCFYRTQLVVALTPDVLWSCCSGSPDGNKHWDLWVTLSVSSEIPKILCVGSRPPWNVHLERGNVSLPVVTVVQYSNDLARAGRKGQENVRLHCLNNGLLAPGSIKGLGLLRLTLYFRNACIHNVVAMHSQDHPVSL